MASVLSQKGWPLDLEHIGVPDDVRRSWQEIVDLLSDHCQVPASLIKRVHKHDMEVYACNRTIKHPYSRGHRDRLDGDRYCEEVIRSRNPLLVTDARKDPRWRDNPDLSLGMVSYLGMPLTWPDGEIFGTICVFDKKANHYSDHFLRLMEKLSCLVMADLHILHFRFRLKHAHKELHQLQEKMIRFMGIAAHDMRNALNVFLGSSKHLLPRGEGLTGRQLTYLDLVQKSGSTLIQLMDELMDIARIEGMHLSLHLEEVDLGAFLCENIRFNQHLADAKGIQINLVLPSEKIPVKVDPSRLDQVLNNLMSNATKFSPDHSTILVSVNIKDDGIVVAIRDQGPGIPRKEQAGLFSPFQTTSIQPTSGETSTGLGLYIARRIVEEHGGHIWVESEPGSGSMFCFRLKKKSDIEGDRRAAKRHPAVTTF